MEHEKTIGDPAAKREPVIVMNRSGKWTCIVCGAKGKLAELGDSVDHDCPPR